MATGAGPRVRGHRAGIRCGGAAAHEGIHCPYHRQARVVKYTQANGNIATYFGDATEQRIG